MRKTLTLLLLVLCLLVAAALARRTKQLLSQQEQTAEQQKTVVEANHFSSTTQTSNSYQLDITKDKPLLFCLKPHPADYTDKALEDNPITITLKDGSNSQQCVFRSYTQLCALEKTTAKKVELKVECKSTPCQLSWEIVQPPLLEQDGDHGLQQLVSVNHEKDHAALRVSCTNLEAAGAMSKDLVLYTNSKYKKITAQNGVGIVFYLFDNPQQGHYFLTTNNEQLKACINASLLHMNDEIAFNKDKAMFMDYLSPEKASSYPIENMPDKEFRIQASAYDPTLQDLDNSTSIKLALIGYSSNKKQILSDMTLSVDNEKSTIVFSAVYKKPAQKFDKMQLQIEVFGRLLMLRARFVAAEVHEVELGEISFFELKKGEQIQYKLVPLSTQVTDIKLLYIFTSDPSKFIASVSSCLATGCTFTVKALQGGQGNVYIGEAEHKNISELIIEPFQKEITAKATMGETHYYSYNAKANEAIQLLINAPSVVVYAASKEKCKVIDEKCYETSFNHHFPAIYAPSKDETLVFKVIALDNCEFTLRVIDGKTPFIELKDTQPFAYLFDDKQSSLVLEFKMDKKEDVSFNLIGPVNELNLLVLNEVAPAKDQKEDWNTAQLSSDGFIKFSKEDIKGLSFAIKVQKRAQFQNKFVHFTLIASTKQANLRLEAGAAHYETLRPKDSRDYVFEFSPDHKIMLNFYTHNIHGKEVNLSLKVSNADKYTDPKSTATFTVDRNVDVLDIGLASSRLCKQNEGQNCQLFVRIQNEMQVEADVTITLLVENSIIELKDGIWQSYRVNGPSTSSHFYFLPKHQNHSATIFYKPSVVDLRIVYNVWKSDDLSIDPSMWPFPVQLQQPTDRFSFKPLQYIHVEPQKLKECWPNCVILLSMLTNSKDFQQAVESNASSIDAQFRIMASNNYIQLPQKHKVDILLSKNESKELLVDLKYYLQKEELTFFTHYTLGKATIKANVYSQTNPRCPTSDDSADFTLDAVETSLALQEIKKKQEENSMDADKNLYLCLLAFAQQNTKFNIEFNSNASAFKKLAVDTTTTLKATSKQYLYYLDLSEQTYVKITRNEGFPYYKTTVCKPQDDVQKCFDQFSQEKQKGTQIANKVTTIAEPPCPKCLLLMKFQLNEQTEIIVHTQSKFTELQLAANSLVADTLQPNTQNRYTLTGTQQQEIIINVQVTSGDVKVAVKDFQKIDIVKSNQKGSKNVHITVPPKDMSNEGKQLGSTHMSSFGLSSFVHLHITVESQDHSKPASYTITYSSGAPVVYLQDGLITQYNLIPKVETKFIYRNPTDSSIYLYTSTENAENLKKLKLRYFGLEDVEDEEAKTQLTPEKAEFNKKTVNPTNLAKLAGKKAYFFTVTNHNDKNTLFTIGVNNREIIYLPFDHQFPIELAQSQYLYLVLNTAGSGYVKVSFSKCSISYPSIAYTTNYQDFIAEDYSIENQMTEDLTSELVLKVNASSGLYIKVKSSETEKTLMSIKAAFSQQKMKSSKAKPGDKGLIQYQLLDSAKAELTLSNVQCPKQQKSCGKDFSFVSLRSDKIENIYSQLVCPSIMFSLPEMQQLKSPESKTIGKGTTDKITFTQDISRDIEYVGVKAVNDKTGEVVYYHPVEIVTFWGQLHRSSETTVALAFFLLLVFALGCLMVYRRYKKHEYKPLGEMNQIIEQE